MVKNYQIVIDFTFLVWQTSNTVFWDTWTYRK